LANSVSLSILVFQAPNAPNSWATAELWRRVLGVENEAEEEEEEENAQGRKIGKGEDSVVAHDVIRGAAEDAAHPINTPETIRAREEFSKNYWKDLIQGNQPVQSNSVQTFEGALHAMSNHPIHPDNEHLYFAQ